MYIEKVDYTNCRIDKLESLIHPMPERWNQGNHYIASIENQDVGYIQIVPMIWLGGQVIPIKNSYWVYIARVAVTHPKYLASMYRKYYEIQTEFLFPLTLISKPTKGDAEIFNARLGFEPAPFANGQGWLVKHCAVQSMLPLQRRPPNLTGKP